jgi:hypothetical protein
MDPNYLTNTPLWNEPAEVQFQNMSAYLSFLQRTMLGLPFYPMSLEVDIADLD